MKENDKFYYTASEVQELLGVSRTKAYEIIKQLNNELAKKGYIVTMGRIPKKYLTERFYGMTI